MAKIDSIKTDLVKEINGVWVPFAEGIELLIARARNPKYLERLRELILPYKKDSRTGDLANDKFEEILKQVRAETVLLGWKNIEDKNGQEIFYTPEQTLRFFQDPELKDFYSFVILISENSDYYRKTIIEDSLKN